MPGGTVGSAAAAALLVVGAVHPHLQLGAGRGQVPEPDLAGDRTLHRRGANATVNRLGDPVQRSLKRDFDGEAH